jgi:hypothetical protein
LNLDEQAEIKQSILRSTLFQLYLLETNKRNPLLAQAFHLEHGKTRRLPVELAGNTWEDDIVSFRGALIDVERSVLKFLYVNFCTSIYPRDFLRHWDRLGMKEECPYHFTQDDLLGHSTDAENWNAVQDFFDSIEDLVKRDGWTSHELFDTAVEWFLELRNRGLDQMKGKERVTFERQTRWVEGTADIIRI